MITDSVVMKSPTMRDVAKFAGVALGTVDRYINGTGRVSDEKSKRIQNAIDALNYIPNKAASALSTKRIVNIGVVFPYVEISFWQQIEKGISRAEKEYEAYGLRVHPVRLKNYSVEQQSRAINELVSAGVQGIAIAPVHDNNLNELIGKLADDGIPVVTFDSDAPLSRRICFVGVDDHKSGEAAAHMLAMLLHEKGRIAVFRAQRDLYAVQQRIAGFREKIAQYPEIYVAHEYDIYNGPGDFKENIERIIDSRFPDDSIKGILVTNGTVGTVASILRRKGLAGRYKIVGFDLADETKDLIDDETISATICSDIEYQGYLAISCLYEKIVHEKNPGQVCHHTGFQVIIKETL